MGQTPGDNWAELLRSSARSRGVVPNRLPGVLAGAHAGTMATVRRVACSGLLFALVLFVSLTGHRGGQVTLFGGGACRSVTVCEHNMDVRPAIAEMLADQVARFGPTCVDPARFVGIPSRVLVRNALAADGDTGVVRAVTLDEALAAAKAGKVYVLKACA